MPFSGFWKDGLLAESGILKMFQMKSWSKRLPFFYLHLGGWGRSPKIDWLPLTIHSSPKEVHIDFTQFSGWPWVTLPEGPSILLKRKWRVTHDFLPANVNCGSANIKIQKSRTESILLHELNRNSLIFLTIFNHFTCSLRLLADPLSPGKIF